jgi:hypothetical protein
MLSPSSRQRSLQAVLIVNMDLPGFIGLSKPDTLAVPADLEESQREFRFQISLAIRSLPVQSFAPTRLACANIVQS